MSATATGELPGFSMVMTCYNVGRFVREAILSCLAQDYAGPLELIIVQDCPKDDTPRVIADTLAGYGGPVPVTVLEHKRNRGVSGATDTGWAAARHPWIIMVDGDDIQLPDRCSKTARVIADNPGLAMIIMSAQKFSDENPDLGILRYCADYYKAEDVPALKLLESPKDRADNYLHHGNNPRLNGYGCTMAFCRELYGQWGNLCRGWDEDGQFAQDPAWELRAFLGHKVCGSLELACRYRLHESNIFSRKESFTYAGLLAKERADARYAAFRVRTLRRMLEDLERARAEGLTDWSAADLDGLVDFLMRKLHGCLLRADWWSVSLVERIRRIRLHKQKADFLVGKWALPRLLPLHLYALLARWQNRKP